TISKRDWSSDVCSSDLPRSGAIFAYTRFPTVGPRLHHAMSVWNTLEAATSSSSTQTTNSHQTRCLGLLLSRTTRAPESSSPRWVCSVRSGLERSLRPRLAKLYLRPTSLKPKRVPHLAH